MQIPTSVVPFEVLSDILVTTYVFVYRMGANSWEHCSEAPAGILRRVNEQELCIRSIRSLKLTEIQLSR